jgi:hypothetical protein
LIAVEAQGAAHKVLFQTQYLRAMWPRKLYKGVVRVPGEKRFHFPGMVTGTGMEAR